MYQITRDGVVAVRGLERGSYTISELVSLDDAGKLVKLMRKGRKTAK